MTTHECPAPECHRAVPQQQFACRNDWFRLPREIRLAISSNHKHDPDAHHAAMAEAFQWYVEHPKAGAR